MQGIESLGYEVVPVPIHEQMGFPDSGIAKFKKAADMMADFGRNGDTYIVHAAEGETVLPMEVLDKNPKLKKMIFKQMEDMGLDPQRYVVGSDLNSINPVTGQPEFFLALIAKTVKKAVKAVVKVVKKIAPVVLPFVAPFVLPTMPVALAAGLGSTAGNLIAGKSLKDSLVEGLKTGAIAGVGQLLQGKSVLGSQLDPKNTQGIQTLGTMFTPDNPFTAGKFNALQQVQNAVSAGPSGVINQAEIEIGRNRTPVFERPTNIREGITSVFKTGDDYGPMEFYDQFISPSRVGITDESSTLRKYGPLAVTALGGAAVSDTLLGTNLITPGAEEKIDRDAILNEGQNLLNEQRDIYGIGEGLYAGNPYYTRSVADSAIAETDISKLPIKKAYESPTAQTSNPYFAAMNAPLQNVGGSGLPDGPQGQYGINTGFAQNLFNQSPPLVANPFLQAKSGGEIVGPGTPTSDSIPAMLSDGEFVMNARAVRGAGGGDRKQGAKRMYEMMRQFERSA